MVDTFFLEPGVIATVANYAYSLLGLAVAALGISMVRAPSKARDVELRLNRWLPRLLRFRPDFWPPDTQGWILIAVGSFAFLAPLLSR